MDEVKQQIIEKLQNANNILVTVSANPSVDQLAACIGLTLLLNKMNKHATAVFSGKVPSTIEFLKPEETIETNTDSLRDFIIALDKAKADKLRYKVEDEIVKIFITPYKSSISEKDLIFSQGDFNVDVVMALGVREPQDLDNAITAHGRILHDAVVICVNTTAHAELGSINWQDEGASGVSELVSGLATSLGANLLDPQISTALLTGIVAETQHFSNAKTTPQTMTSSAALLAAGANQQLVSKQLAENSAVAVVAPAAAVQKQAENGELDVPHSAEEKPELSKLSSADAAPDTTVSDEVVTDKVAEQPATPEEPVKDKKPADKLPTKSAAKNGPKMKRIEPLPDEAEEPVESNDSKDSQDSQSEPAAEQQSPADTLPVDHSIDALLQQAEDELAQPLVAPELPKPNPQPSAPVLEVPPAPEFPKPDTLTPANTSSPDASDISAPSPQAAEQPKPSAEPPAPAPAEPAVNSAAEPVVPVPDAAGKETETLSDLEQAVHSPHVDMAETAGVDSARKAVEDALQGAADPLPAPIEERAGAVSVELDLGHQPGATDPTAAVPSTQPGPGMPSAEPLPSSPQPATGLPDYLQTTPLAPAPTGNAATSNMPPFEDLASTPVPAGVNVPPPQLVPSTSTTLPPQGPPPPVPPPMPGA